MQHAFNPREMALLMRVVDQACADFAGCDEATKATIALRVLAYADRGERDFDRLLAIARDRPDKVCDEKDR